MQVVTWQAETYPDSSGDTDPSCPTCASQLLLGGFQPPLIYRLYRTDTIFSSRIPTTLKWPWFDLSPFFWLLPGPFFGGSPFPPSLHRPRTALSRPVADSAHPTRGRGHRGPLRRPGRFPASESVSWRRRCLGYEVGMPSIFSNSVLLWVLSYYCNHSLWPGPMNLVFACCPLLVL